MSNVKSREEIRFLALLTKTQEKAAGLKNEKKKQNGDSGVKSADSLDETEVKSENGTNHDKWRLPKVRLYIYLYSFFPKKIVSLFYCSLLIH
jgi:hypothetical protein